jgi:hypothetical protein
MVKGKNGTRSIGSPASKRLILSPLVILSSGIGPTSLKVPAEACKGNESNYRRADTFLPHFPVIQENPACCAGDNPGQDRKNKKDHPRLTNPAKNAAGPTGHDVEVQIQRRVRPRNWLIVPNLKRGSGDDMLKETKGGHCH